MSPCAAESHRKAVLALLDVARDKFFDELGSSVDEFLGDIVFQDILGDLLVVACKFFEARYIVRVGYEAHVQSPVGLKGYAVFVSEGHDVDHESAVLASFIEKPIKLCVHLCHLQR